MAAGRAALLVLALAAAAPQASAMTAGNLVRNGDGESPVGAEWTASAGSLTRSAYGQGGYPGAVLIGGGGFDGGTAMLHGAGASTLVTQVVTLGTEDREAVDTGTVRARLSAFVGGYGTQDDRLGVGVAWRGADGATLSTQALPPVTAAERGGVSGFLARRDEQPVPAGARSALVTLTGTRDVGPAQDGYLDDLVLRLIGIPEVGVAFPGAGTAATGTPTPVAFTVRNSADLEAKPGWAFSIALPAGLAVSSATPARTTCAGGGVRVAGGVVEASGTTRAGEESCTFTLDVVAATPGTYAVDSTTVSTVRGLRRAPAAGRLVVRDAAPGPGDEGGAAVLPPAVQDLRPPTAVAPADAPVRPGPDATGGPPAGSPPPAVLASADAQLALAPGSPATVRGGRTVRLRARVRNRTRRVLSGVDVCVRPPAGTTVLPRADDGARVGPRRCWTLHRLTARAGRTVALTVRVGRGPRAVGLRWRAGAAEALGVTTADEALRVTR